MAFSSKLDAITKLTSSYFVPTSSNLYLNNTNFDGTTTFYTNAAKTTLAPAGTYVIPTNYRSLFVTLNSSGKISGSVSYFDIETYDTNWVDDKLRAGGGTATLYVYSNSLDSNGSTDGGTELYLSESAGRIYLKDSVWDATSGAGYYSTTYNIASGESFSASKRWNINQSYYNYNTSLQTTGIDITDMKGFDLFMISGLYGTWSTGNTGNSNYAMVGWPQYKTVQGFIHLKADSNRTTVIGNRTYFFKPDYWIPNINQMGPNFFRKSPTVSGSIKNQYGITKFFDDQATYMGDVTNFPGDPQPYSSPFQFSGTSVKSSSQQKRFDKGITGGTGWQQGGYGTAVDSTNSIDFGGFDNSLKAVWSDMIIKNPSNPPYPGYPPLQSDEVTIWAYMQSCWLVDQGVTSGNLANYSISWGGQTRDCLTANPSAESMGASSFIPHFAPYLNSLSIKNQQYLQWPDYENGFEGWRGVNGEAWDWAWTKAGQYANTLYNDIGGDWGPTGSLPDFAFYEKGNYHQTFYGTWSWRNADNPNTYQNSNLYQHYHNYYTLDNDIYSTNDLLEANFDRTPSGSLARKQLYNIGYMHGYENDNFQYYALVHGWDIGHKILYDVLGTHNHGILIGINGFHLFDIVPGSEINAVRGGVSSPGGLFNNIPKAEGLRLNLPPSTYWNLNMWGIGYADGVHWWDFGFHYDLNTIGYRGAPEYGPDNVISRVIHGGFDWAVAAYYQLWQNKDILEDSTSWTTPEYYDPNTSSWVTGTDLYPVSLWAKKRPLFKIKYNTAGDEALVMVLNIFNNGYSKETHIFRATWPGDASQTQFTIDTYGTYTSLVRMTKPVA